jgi:hypothetical protein
MMIEKNKNKRSTEAQSYNVLRTQMDLRISKWLVCVIQERLGEREAFMRSKGQNLLPFVRKM